MSLCKNDNTLGPRADCRPLDFTVGFEHSVLSITLDVAFLVVALARMWYLAHQTSKLECPSYFHCGAKAMSVLFVSTAMLGTNIVLYKHHVALALPQITLISSALSLSTTIPLALLTWLEHFRALTPSTVLLNYLLLKGLFNTSILRTYLALGISRYSAGRILLGFSSLGIASPFALMAIEAIEKKRLLNSTYKDYPKESLTSVFTRPVFLWLFPLLWKGSKTRLALEDAAAIPPRYKAVPSRAPLEAALSNTENLRRASIIAFGGSFISPLLASLVLVFATFGQPLLVQSLLTYIQDSDSSSEEGWALVGGFFCVYGVLTLATAVFWEKVFDLVVRYRGALVGVILQKSLRMAAHESRSIGPAKAGTYMSVDVGQVADGLERFYDVFGSSVSIVLGIIILYSKTRWAAFLPIIVIAFTMGATSYCGKIIGGRYSAWMGAADKRIKLMASVISHLVPIKLSAYEIPLLKKLNKLRGSELGRASDFFSLMVVNITLSNASGAFCAVAVLGAYAWMVQRDPTIGKFDAASVFTILTTVQLLKSPLATIGQVLPTLFSSYASLKRIETFLNLEDKAAMECAEPDNSEPYEIRLSGVTASWDKTSKPVLHDVSFTIGTGLVYMCVGPVASGKTSLLMTMLDETVITQGLLHTSPSLSNVAYVSQDAFIAPGTIHDNITFGSPFDPARYAEVVRACALEADLARLHEGDLTMVGGGVGLSGGQKQRVALARAVYSNAGVMLLDDPLSALDAETESYVSKALFGPSGLLMGRSVFMVTHNVRHLQSADTVLVMNQGKISFTGTFDELRASDYDLSHVTNSTSENGQPAIEKIEFSTGTDPTDKGKVNGTTVNDESKKSYTPQGWRPYKFWACMAGQWRVLLSLSLMVLSVALSLGMNIYAKFWSDSEENMTQWIMGYFGLSVAYFVFIALAFSTWFKGANIVASTAIHARALKALSDASASYVQNTPAGLLINRFSQDLSTIGFGFPMSIFGAFSATLLLAGSLALISVATPWLALSFPLFGVAYWLLIKFYLATSTQLQQLESASKSPLFAAFGTIITGLETIRSFGSQRMFSYQSDSYLNASQGPLYFRNAGIRFLRTTLAFITLLIAVGMACLAVGLRRFTSPGLMGVALTNLTRVSGLLSGLLTSWVNLENGAVSVERVYEIIELEPESDHGTLEVSSAWPSDGNITFEDFSMRYSSHLPLVLQNLSFNVQGGLRVGICGRTGSGKSSTVNALFRAIGTEFTSGRILIDGVDIKNLSLHVLRSSLSIVPQDPFLWHSTIRENLDLEEAYSDDQIWQVLERVGMKEAVAALDENLDTVLQDSVAFSRGQRQLLCMARILLQKRKIVVLDEASSSMDTKTDEKIQQIMSEDLKDCTIIAVAHRIATIIDFDLVLVFEDGNIVETGPPRTLLVDSSTRFAKLANNQGVHASPSE